MRVQFLSAIAAALALTVPCLAQSMSYGETEFLDSCAACHGKNGRGHGPVASELVRQPPDLTRLSERNGGEFPYNRVFAVIDGRYVVPGHGNREMPVWGQRFVDQDTKMYGPSGGEILATERIHELANYIQSIQR